MKNNVNPLWCLQEGLPSGLKRAYLNDSPYRMFEKLPAEGMKKVMKKRYGDRVAEEIAKSMNPRYSKGFRCDRHLDALASLGKARRVAKMEPDAVKRLVKKAWPGV